MKDGTSKNTIILKDMKIEILDTTGYKHELTTSFDYLPCLVLDYFQEVSEYVTKYNEVTSLLLKLMVQEDFDASINRSKPFAMTLPTIAMNAAGHAFPEFKDDHVLMVKQVNSINI
ncbi:unnamed protein product [Linum trigynum]|uniref:Uncharacterized protein n=1 Tax=Linum trigynum TaxID=586398 RepID=A0AAV2ENA3_9ROSI